MSSACCVKIVQLVLLSLYCWLLHRQPITNFANCTTILWHSMCCGSTYRSVHNAEMRSENIRKRLVQIMRLQSKQDVCLCTFQNLNKPISAGTYSIDKRPPRPGSRNANSARHKSNDGLPIVRKPRKVFEKPQFKFRTICCNCVASISAAYLERSL